jgi:hypothetical protein
MRGSDTFLTQTFGSLLARRDDVTALDLDYEVDIGSFAWTRHWDDEISVLLG